MSHRAKRLRYVLKPLLHAIPIVFAIIVVNFFLLQMAEGDAVDVLAGEAGSATPEYMAELCNSQSI
jgi:peptide/nickel transport system permease protein